MTFHQGAVTPTSSDSNSSPLYEPDVECQKDFIGKSAHLNYETLSAHFHLPITDVAKELGVCATMLKKVCRKHGIPRWPYRQLKSLNRMIHTLEACSNDIEENVDEMIEDLKKKREALLENPRLQDSLLADRKQFRMITKRNCLSVSSQKKASQSNEVRPIKAAPTCANFKSYSFKCNTPLSVKTRSPIAFGNSSISQLSPLPQDYYPRATSPVYFESSMFCQRPAPFQDTVMVSQELKLPAIINIPQNPSPFKLQPLEPAFRNSALL